MTTAAAATTAKATASASQRSQLLVTALLCASAAAAAAALAYFAYRSTAAPSHAPSTASRRSRKKSATATASSSAAAARGGSCRAKPATDASASASALSAPPSPNSSATVSSSSPAFQENLERLVKEASDAAHCAALSEVARANLAEQLKDHGNVYFKESKSEDAVKMYTLAVQVCPEILTLYSNRAAAYIALRDFDAAIVDSTRVLEKNPTFEKAYYRRGHSYSALKKHKLALFDFMTLSVLQGFKEEHTVSMIERVISEAALEQIALDKATPKPCFHSSVSARHSISCVTDLIFDWLDDQFKAAMVEKSPEWHFARAIDLISLASFDEAFEELDAAQALLPAPNNQLQDSAAPDNSGRRYGDILTLYSTLCSLSKRDKESLQALQQAQLHYGAKPSIFHYLLRSTFALEANDSARAREIMDEALLVAPDNAFVHYQCGQQEFLSNNTAAAIACFSRAQKLRPDFIFAHIQHAVSLYRNGDKRECLDRFGEALQNFPRSADLCNFFGEILFDMEDFQGAATYFERAITLDSKMTLARINFAALSQLKGDIVSAEKHLQAAIAQDSRTDFALIQLCSLLIQMQRNDEGMALLDKLLALARNENELLTYYITKLRTLGDIEITQRLSRKTIERGISLAIGH